MGLRAVPAQGTVAVLLTLAPPCHTRICQLASKQLAAGSWQQEGRAAEDASAATLHGPPLFIFQAKNMRRKTLTWTHLLGWRPPMDGNRSTSHSHKGNYGRRERSQVLDGSPEVREALWEAASEPRPGWPKVAVRARPPPPLLHQQTNVSAQISSRPLDCQLFGCCQHCGCWPQIIQPTNQQQAPTCFSFPKYKSVCLLGKGAQKNIATGETSLFFHFVLFWQY